MCSVHCLKPSQRILITQNISKLLTTPTRPDIWPLHISILFTVLGTILPLGLCTCYSFCLVYFPWIVTRPAPAHHSHLLPLVLLYFCHTPTTIWNFPIAYLSSLYYSSSGLRPHLPHPFLFVQHPALAGLAHCLFP